MEKRKVVIEVLGGVADVTQCPDDVEVQIIDHDNQETEAECPFCLGDDGDIACTACGYLKGDGVAE